MPRDPRLEARAAAVLEACAIALRETRRVALEDALAAVMSAPGPIGDEARRYCARALREMIAEESS